MHEMKIILLFIITSVLLSACLPDPLSVDNVPQLEPKIVVSSQIIPDSGLVVLVTKSIGALDAGRSSDAQALLEQIVINDATVTLHHEGKVDTLLNLGNGIYGGLTPTWQQNNSYELRVKTTLLGEVSAISEVKQRITFQSVNATVYSTGYDSLALIDYGISDPVGKNFYMINVQRFSTTQNINSLLNPRVFTHLVNDSDFDGKYYQENFKVFFQDYSVGDSVAVFLSNIDEGYYQFLKLRNDNRYGIADFASEPTNYPTNVQGGYGFFNLHVPDVRVFVMK
jgi:Domain of unknown function (DUF4249)